MTTIEHVRHRVAWTGEWPIREQPFAFTACGMRFKPAHPVNDRRSIEHHEPARRRCEACW